MGQSGRNLSPFRFEPKLTKIDYQTLGRLTLKWSHVEHFIANSIRVMRGLTMDQAIKEVFSLTLDRRLAEIERLAEQHRGLDADAKLALRELRTVMNGLKLVRNSVVHAIVVIDDPDREEPYFHSRRRKLNFTKKQVFSTEALTDYAGHAALSFRYALGGKGIPIGERHLLPSRPEIPGFLKKYIGPLSKREANAPSLQH